MPTVSVSTTCKGECSEDGAAMLPPPKVTFPQTAERLNWVDGGSRLGTEKVRTWFVREGMEKCVVVFSHVSPLVLFHLTHLVKVLKVVREPLHYSIPFVGILQV